MNAKTTKRKIVNAIYRALNARRITGRLYRDENWQAVNDIVETARTVTGEAWVTVENGGYIGKRKEYRLTAATADGLEVNGLITCSAAGSCSNPFDAYDVTLVMF